MEPFRHGNFKEAPNFRGL